MIGRTGTGLPSSPRRRKTRYPGVFYRPATDGERRYEINYTDSNGKRVFKTVDGTEKDAVRERNKILERMHKGERVVSSKMTVRQLAEDWHRTQTSHLKPSTLNRYGYDLDHYIYPRLGDKQVSSLGVDDIADFIAEMRQTHAAWTIRGCLTPLSRMFQYAVRRGWASTNPVTALDRQERPKGSGRQMRILSSDEISLMLKASTDTYKCLLMTATFAGLRIGELLRLLWDDVDLLTGEIHVRESKTDAGVRTVAIPDFLVQALAQYSLTHGSQGHVFKTKHGEPMKHRRVNRALEETLNRAKVEHIRFHDLRHTFVSILVSERMDVTYIADQVGHSSAAVTLGIYSHLFDSEKRKAEGREKIQTKFAGLVS